MVKKYVAVCMCILAVCAVLGLNARTEYPQIKTALEHANTSAKILQSDLEFLRVYATILEDFSLDQRVYADLETYEDDGSGMGEYYVIRIESGSEHEFTFYDFDTAKKLENILKPMEWKLPEGNNAVGNGITSGIVGVWNSTIEAIGTIVYMIGIVFSFAMFALTMVLDSVLTAWSMVEIAMYIIGLPVSL